MKHLHIWVHPLREWQGRAFDQVMAQYDAGNNNFLCVATPGAGKTRFALRTAHKFLQLGIIQRIVVTVHTEHLKKQWAIDATQYGIELDPNLDNDSPKETDDFHGAVITYAQLGMNPEAHERACNQIPTMVIGDEWHHLGDELTWGDAAQKAFANAKFRLLLSGTPFRNDANTIPFVSYKDGKGKADYTYTYEESIIDKVCRAVYFPAYDGIMNWRTDGIDYEHSFADDLSDSRSSERLKTALAWDGNFLKQMIKDADNKLLEIREKEWHTDAGGLIIAIDQDHAKKVAETVYKVTGSKPIIVLSEDKESSARIKEFKDSTSKWLIAVKMVSEGVDLPRLRIIVYATNVRSELFFRQVVGRVVRILKHLEAQEAFVYIPKDKSILRFASQIEEEREHALDKAEVNSNGTDIGLGEETEPKQGKKFESISSRVTETEQLELSFNDKIQAMFKLPPAVAKNIGEKIKLKNQTPEDIPVFERRIKLRDEINNLAKIAAKKKANGTGTIDWEYYHKLWIKRGGGPIDEETLEDLERRRKWLQKFVN